MKINSLLLCLMLVTMLLAVSCQPSKVSDEDIQRCVPGDLKIATIHSEYAKITWDPGCPKLRVMRGFNIYVSPVPLVVQYPGRDLPASIQPHNPMLYPGDTEGNLDRESFEIEGIANATKYYVHVRAVFNDKSMSLPTNEVELVCYPQGELTLGVSYSGQNDGFSFVKDAYCATDDLENDIYFYNRDGKDYICSPARLGPVNRESKLYLAGKGTTLPDLQKLTPQGSSSERIEARLDENIVLITAEGHTVGLYVRQAEGSGESRKLVLEYIYQPPLNDSQS